MSLLPPSRWFRGFSGFLLLSSPCTRTAVRKYSSPISYHHHTAATARKGQRERYGDNTAAAGQAKNQDQILPFSTKKAKKESAGEISFHLPAGSQLREAMHAFHNV